MTNRQLWSDQHRIGRVPVPGVPLAAENAVIENAVGDEILAFLRNRRIGFKPGKHILEAELVPPRLHISAQPVTVEKHFLLQLRFPRRPRHLIRADGRIQAAVLHELPDIE